MTELLKIRGYTQIALWKDGGSHENLKRLKNQFLERCHQQSWMNQVEEFNLQAESIFLYNQTQNFFQVDLPHAQDHDLFAEYSHLITGILQLMQLAADRSNLILDPELDTYYLIDILDKQIPYLAESIGRVRGIGSGFISIGAASKEDFKLLQSYLSAIQTRIENIENAQAIIAKVASNMTDDLHLVSDEFDEAVAMLFKESSLIKDEQVCREMDPEKFFQRATHTIELLATPYYTGIVMLTSRVQARQDRHLLQGGIVFFGTSFAILLMLYFNRAFYLYDRKHYETVAKLSVTDQLTGLYNRRHFYTVFPRELRNTLRHGGGLYLGILDVDYFKRYNDTYGHPKGDLVLQQISKSMNEVLQRAGDYCFRIGGEEFSFFFNELNLKNAEDLIGRIRSSIEDLAIAHEGNQPFGVVTVSIGLIEVPDAPDCALETLMSKAGQALYIAKET
ncbi:MAG TPA: GGDEF domain-containing protein, partial [Desulfobacterales bacterium]|nr:GGDEF domain-containing protein [Desulfobacterales bacterium]